MSEKNVTKPVSSAVETFLEQVRRTPAAVRPPGTRGRLIFAMDATASREPTWDRACEVQGQMFLEADRRGGLEVQLAFYRGFHECKASRWVASARGLVDLMTRVRCRAGQTQIRRILRHAAGEAAKQRVQALVFIGDCMEESLDEVAHLAGELGLLGVRAFMFHEGVDPEAERAFKEVARLTGGAYCRFDRGSARELRELLGAVAAFAAGGSGALADLRRHGSPGVRLLAAQIRD
ncbi:VWA domain-containing protein [Geminicoccaceae bacterium 1502E]|nr:VWA domain-containing protein [Geminicoccaceae bacterium 1502E]